MNRRDYWIGAVESSLAEAGIAATAAQIASIAEDMHVARDQEGMAFGDDVADANLRATRKEELADLRRELREERAKITCKTCKGRGSIIENGATRSAEFTCGKCKGAGRI